MMWRVGTTEHNILAAQSNLASTYQAPGRPKALQLRQEVYSGCLKHFGEEHRETLIEANNYALNLLHLRRFEEAKALLRKTIPVVQRVFGLIHDLTLTINVIYAEALYKDDGATLDDLREAVSTLEETDRTARRVLGGEHPLTVRVGDSLRDARAARAARETPPRDLTEGSVK